MGDLQAIPKSQMSDKERVRDFQRKLYRKAKQDKSFRFYVLYDKVRLPHFLREAYKRCKANRDGGLFCEYGIKIIRYADDWVLMARILPDQALESVRELLNRMKLRINEEKSRVVNAYAESFDFLGYTFRLGDDLFGRRGRKYWNIEPSSKSQKKVKEKIREYMRLNGHKAPQDVASELNAIIRGWINYFTINGISYPNRAKRNLRYYLFKKLMRFYKRKSQRKSKLYNRGAFRVLVSKYGLIDPTKYALS